MAQKLETKAAGPKKADGSNHSKIRVYMDNSATTPVFPQAVEAMVDCMTNHFGNPSSIHGFGRDAYKALDQARGQVASLINADKSEIYFTSGGTEADNLAIFGTASRYEAGHIITSAIEHPAVLDTCQYLAKKGYEITYLPVGKTGMISPQAVAAAIRPNTILLTLMHANNEVGTIQPLEEIGKIAKSAGVVFHIDAVQSAGKIEVDVEKLSADMLTYSSHKINGPKGVGALYLRKGVKLNRVAHGGGQEKKLRSGTENMPGIVGFGVAAALTAKSWREHAAHTQKLRDYLFSGLQAEISGVTINGSLDHRLPHNANLSFSNVEGEALLLYLDSAGIAVSSGSACSAGSLSPSHVLKAMGLSAPIMQSAVRITLGKDNTLAEMDYVISVFKEKVEALRQNCAYTL